MIFCTAVSKRIRFGCITTSWNQEASHLNSITPLLLEGKKSKTQPSAGKCMLRVFWDWNGIIHKKYMVKGIRINSRTYMMTLKRLEQQIAFNGEKKVMLLQHEDARPHTNAATSAVWDSIKFEVVPHHPYSLDLAPPDFWLFETLKKYLEGNHFTCHEEVQAAMAKWFQEQPVKFYTNGYEKLVRHWRHCNEQ